MVSYCRLLGVRSFVPEVRSWSGNDVPLFLMNVIVCSDKEQSPKAQFSPSKGPVLAKRRQILVWSSFRARFPHLFSCHPWGRKASNTTGPQSPQTSQMGRLGLTNCDPDRQPLLLGHRELGDGGEVFCCLKAWAKVWGRASWGPCSLAGHVPSLFSGPSSSPCWPKAG